MTKASIEEYAALLRLGLIGTVLVRIDAEPDESDELEEGWPAPRGFVYTSGVTLITDVRDWNIHADECDGDLRIDRPRVSTASGGGRRVVDVTFGRCAASGLLESFVLELEDGSTVAVFTGELDEDATGEPRIRPGDEMLFLFDSVEEAESEGLRHEPTTLAGRDVRGMTSWLDPRS